LSTICTENWNFISPLITRIHQTDYFQFEVITLHLSGFASASRFKVQKEKKVTCSHEDYQVLCQRVGDGKGRVVGNET